MPESSIAIADLKTFLSAESRIKTLEGQIDQIRKERDEALARIPDDAKRLLMGLGGTSQARAAEGGERKRLTREQTDQIKTLTLATLKGKKSGLKMGDLMKALTGQIDFPIKDTHLRSVLKGNDDLFKSVGEKAKAKWHAK